MMRCPHFLWPLTRTLVTAFQPLIAQFDGQMIVLTDLGFHA